MHGERDAELKYENITANARFLGEIKRQTTTWPDALQQFKDKERGHTKVGFDFDISSMPSRRISGFVADSFSCIPEFEQQQSTPTAEHPLLGAN